MIADDDDDAFALPEEAEAEAVSASTIWVEDDPSAARFVLLESVKGPRREKTGSPSSTSGTATHRAALSTNLESAPVTNEAGMWVVY